MIMAVALLLLILSIGLLLAATWSLRRNHVQSFRLLWVKLAVAIAPGIIAGILLFARYIAVIHG